MAVLQHNTVINHIINEFVTDFSDSISDMIKAGLDKHAIVKMSQTLIEYASANCSKMLEEASLEHSELSNFHDSIIYIRNGMRNGVLVEINIAFDKKTSPILR